jgi:hypothetical protein
MAVQNRNKAAITECDTIEEQAITDLKSSLNIDKEALRSIEIPPVNDFLE